MATYRVLYGSAFGPSAAPAEVDPAAYREVARVEAADLEALFREMNAVGGTETCCRLRVRSMSVGDVAIDVATGEAWYCAAFGWERVAVRGAA